MAKDQYVQAVRGLAIAAVVLIHCLPQEAASVALRPFLNFAVAAFVFLSGYLTPRERSADAGAFLRRRVGKIAAPYVVWTVVYLVARGALAPMAVLAAFIVGGGSAQLYYLVVYLQLVLLTPWLFRLLDRPAARAALYAVTPLTLCVRYALSVAGFSLPIQAFCGSWLVFYLLGLEWRDRIGPCLRDRGVGSRHVLVALAACLVLQELEGFYWLALGNYDLATTQLKATSMLSSVCACVLVPLVGAAIRKRFELHRPLTRLGDLSFGVYLCHMAVLMVSRKCFELLGFTGFFASLVLWLTVLVASSFFVALWQRALPKHVLGLIGFA